MMDHVTNPNRIPETLQRRAAFGQHRDREGCSYYRISNKLTCHKMILIPEKIIVSFSQSDATVIT